MDNNSTDDATMDVSSISTAQFYAYGIVGFLAFIGNGIVFIMASTIKSLRKKTHVHFILFLSLSDTLVGVSVCMLSVSSITGYHEVSFCVVVQILQYSSFTTSSIQTFFVCLERYVAIRGSVPIWFVPKRKNIYMMCNWVISVTSVTFLMVISSKSEHSNDCRLQILYVDNGIAPSMALGVGNFLLVLLIAAFYMMTVYKIVKKIRKSNTVIAPEVRNIQAQPSQNALVFTRHSDTVRTITSIASSASTHQVDIRPGTDVQSTRMPVSYQKGMKRTFITVTIILVEYAICFGAGAFLLIIRSFMDISVLARAVGFSLPILNSFTNPFLYAWRLRDFRKYLRLTCRTWCQQRHA